MKTNKLTAAFEFSNNITPAIEAQTNNVQRHIFLGGVFVDRMFAYRAAADAGQIDNANEIFGQMTRVAQEHMRMARQIKEQIVFVD